MRQFRVRAIEPLALIGAGLAITALVALGTLDLDRRGPAVSPASIQHPDSKIQNSPDPLAPMPIIRRLCCAAFAGRKAGTAGADRAATWLAEELQRIGLEPPPGAPHFRQPFTMPVSLLASPWDRKARLTGPSGASTFIEYPCFRGSGFSQEAEAIFAGSGVSRRDQGWDDYQGRDVRGKYVLYWDGGPPPARSPRERSLARRAGARCLGCLVSSRHPDAGPIGLESPMRDFPVLRLDAKTAQRLFGAAIPAPRAHPGPALAPLRIDIPRAETICPARGEHHRDDPRRRSGRRRRGGHPLRALRSSGASPAAIYPGADDDASGVAGAPAPPRRSARPAPAHDAPFCSVSGRPKNVGCSARSSTWTTHCCRWIAPISCSRWKWSAPAARTRF